jgi:prophage tail gpP-like protein
MPENVAITLDSGERFGFWSEVEIARGLDCYTALSISGPFDHGRTEVRRAFQPLTFKRVTVTVGGELVLTGRIKDTAPNVDPGMSSIGLTAYSLAQTLAEINPADELLPLEYNGLDLRQIGDKLVTASIGERPEFDGPPGATFARVRCEPDSSIHSFLVDLAVQRAFVLADSPNGAPLFRSEAKPGAPVARLRGQPICRIEAQIDPAQWYSTVTGRATRKSGRKGARFTARNPLYRGDFHVRPYVTQLSDTESADMPRAVNAIIGRMVASVVRYRIDDLPTWRDPQGKLWAPNTTVTVLAPEAMIYRETELMIRSVRLRQSAESETASLELTLPGSFGGTLPKGMPWDF